MDINKCQHSGRLVSTRDVALYQQTTQQIRTYLQSVPTIYLPSHDPESAHRLATRTEARLVNA